MRGGYDGVLEKCHEIDAQRGFTKDSLFGSLPSDMKKSAGSGVDIMADFLRNTYNCNRLQAAEMLAKCPSERLQVVAGPGGENFVVVIDELAHIRDQWDGAR